MVRLADNTFSFHPVNQRRGPIVADLQAPLEIAGGGLFICRDDCDSAVIKPILAIIITTA